MPPRSMRVQVNPFADNTVSNNVIAPPSAGVTDGHLIKSAVNWMGSIVMIFPVSNVSSQPWPYPLQHAKYQLHLRWLIHPVCQTRIAHPNSPCHCCAPRSHHSDDHQS